MSIGIAIIISYFVLINIVTFCVWGIDKRKAKNQKRRIKEKTLLSFVGAGGGIGALMGMEYFRHKTIKGKFLTWFWLWTGIWIVAMFALIFLIG